MSSNGYATRGWLFAPNAASDAGNASFATLVGSISAVDVDTQPCGMVSWYVGESFDCPEAVACHVSGVATTSLTLNGQTHTVDHYYGNACAPADLGPLEDAIDSLADSAAWLECDTPSGACCDPAGNPFLFPCN